MSLDDFTAWRGAYVTENAMRQLDQWAEHDAEATAWAAYDWLHINEAGLPLVAMVDGKAREDARFWAETAHPAELECYALAAVDRLGGISGGHALFASRQIKRLAGALFKRMSLEEQAAFGKWIGDQINERG